ncbi:DNA-binding protein Ewg isoform X3 [Hermetia illucens]|uniref:DNA-binding protein Ewg isoform X3 n=1 Tax=Hermetia illucens TaxID=343691 RepID=UPI0018CC2B3F|nr:DNA-binding protein Ewg isoform X3 [Hermetia illucens]
MNASTVTTSTTNHTTTVNKTYKIEMIEDGAMSGQSDDDDDEPPSSPGSTYDDGQDIMQMHMDDEVTSQLAAAGPVGVAAAAAIASAKKRKRPHSFETNPSIRKRQQNRLLRKLRQIIYEFTGRVGQQAIVLVATPGKPNTSYKVFGAKPLEDVVRNLKGIVMEELETALAQQAPPPPQEDPSLFELPPLIIDGIPTPVEKMTQAQLRAFIPLMLKYSTGRGKPGWGRESTRPPWWPLELPWANVRMDARTEEEKQKISWTHALRKIVINCYRYHGREDLLPTFSDEEDKVNQMVNNGNNVSTTTTGSTNNYTQTVLSTIQNPDGTLSLIQVDPNNPIITLPDGTTAQVQGVATLHTTAQGETGATIQTVQQLTDANGHAENMTVDLTEATLGQDGQIIITGEDGQGYPVSVSSMITVPVSASMYQTMVANIQQLHPNGDGTVCITPMQVDSNNHSFQCYPIQGSTSGKIFRAILQNPPVRCQLNSSNSANNIINNSSTSSNSSVPNATLVAAAPPPNTLTAVNNISHHNNSNNSSQNQNSIQSKVFLNNNNICQNNNTNSTRASSIISKTTPNKKRKHQQDSSNIVCDNDVDETKPIVINSQNVETCLPNNIGPNNNSNNGNFKVELCATSSPPQCQHQSQTPQQQPTIKIEPDAVQNQ